MPKTVEVFVGKRDAIVAVFQRGGSVAVLTQKCGYTCSVSYDISNFGPGLASSCKGAAIIHEFVKNVDWIHVDIRSVGMLTQTGMLPYLLKNRMTGRPTRTIIQFLYQMACPDQTEKSCK